MARLIDHEENRRIVAHHLYGAREASSRLGCSETTVRKICREIDVQRLSGRSPRGFVLFESASVPVSIPYFD